MADLRYGIVTFKDQRVGVLSELSDGGCRFAYDAGVTRSISCSLPVSRPVHDHPHGLHPFFAHLAPEGWLRGRQTAYADVDRNDDFGILLAFGADCIGAVGVIDPAHSHDRVRLKEGTPALDAAAVAGDRTISGVQAKVLCREEEGAVVPAAADGPAPLIAKYPAEPPLHDMVANEATTLELCRLLLGDQEVVQAGLGPVAGIEGVALLVRRFDRRGGEKLACEDVAQIIGKPPGLDLKGKYEASYEVLGKALEHSAARLLDARQVFKRLVAFVLVGNVDCHLKNWSLLETPEGLRLSPAYDVQNGYIYGAAGYTTRFGLMVGTDRMQWGRYDRALLLTIAEHLGLPRRAAEGVLREVARLKEPTLRRLDAPLRFNEERTWAYRATVRSAWERIFD